MLAVVWAMCLLCSPGSAQKLAPDELRISSASYQLAPLAIRVASSNVPVEVVVRDSVTGKAIGGLSKANFQIFDNGKLRPVASFAVAEAGARGAGGAVARPSSAAVVVPPAQEPRYLALYFDDVNTGTADLAHARIAGGRFVREELSPGDFASVITSSGLQAVPFTADRQRLEAAIAEVRPHPRAPSSTSGCLHLTAFQAYLIVNHLDPTALSAALAVKQQCDKQVGVFQATDGVHSSTPGSASLPRSLSSQVIPGSDEPSEVVIAEANALWSQVQASSRDTLDSMRQAVGYLAEQPSTRVLVVASGGFLAGTLGNEQDEIIRGALRAQITINCLDARGLYSNELGNPLNELPELQTIPLSLFQFQEDARATEGEEREAAMANLAEGTGGILFHNNNDLTLGFRRVGLSPAVTYNLSFNIPDVPHDGKFHSLRVRVTPNRHVIVQARRGYFAPAADVDTELASPGRLEDAMDAAMRTATPLQSLPATVRVRVETAPGAREAVHLQFHINVARVPFLKQDGRQADRIVFIAGLFNGAGQMVTGKRAEMDLRLKSDSWRAMQAAGLDAELSLVAAPSAYTVRVVVAEANRGAMYAATLAPE